MGVPGRAGDREAPEPDAVGLGLVDAEGHELGERREELAVAVGPGAPDRVDDALRLRGHHDALVGGGGAVASRVLGAGRARRLAGLVVLVVELGRRRRGGRGREQVADAGRPARCCSGRGPCPRRRRSRPGLRRAWCGDDRRPCRDGFGGSFPTPAGEGRLAASLSGPGPGPLRSGADGAHGRLRGGRAGRAAPRRVLAPRRRVRRAPRRRRRRGPRPGADPAPRPRGDRRAHAGDVRRRARGGDPRRSGARGHPDRSWRRRRPARCGSSGCSRRGCIAVLSKPLEEVSFLAAVRRALGEDE